MPTGWFLVRFDTIIHDPPLPHSKASRRISTVFPVLQIKRNGGECKWIEVEENQALIKVRTSDLIYNQLKSQFKELTKPEIDTRKVTPTFRRKPRFDGVSKRLVLDGERIDISPDAVFKLDEKVK